MGEYFKSKVNIKISGNNIILLNYCGSLKVQVQ